MDTKIVTINLKTAIGKIGKEKWNKIKNIKIGDNFTFGTYEQDNGKENIEWLVLDKTDNKILVISKYGLDCQQYNTTDTDVTWETCTLRQWLNNDFINSAFSADEKAMISTFTVSADSNPEYSTNAGNATQDKVFLLSITEAKKYFTSSKERKCVPTEYAIAQGAFTSAYYTKDGKATCHSWLRSPGSDQGSVIVDVDGSLYYYGINVNRDNVCVRPALWIDLNS